MGQMVCLAHHQENSSLRNGFRSTSCEIMKATMVLSLGDGLLRALLPMPTRARLASWNRSRATSWLVKHDGAIADRRPGHVPTATRSRRIWTSNWNACDEGLLYTWGRCDHDIAPRLRFTVTSGIFGAAMIGWFAARLLCYVTPQGAWAVRIGMTSKRPAVTYRLLPTRLIWPRASWAQNRSITALSKRGSSFAGQDIS